MLSMLFLAYVVVGAAQERVARDAMPTLIGEVREEVPFVVDISRYSTGVWADLLIAYAPQIVPEQVARQREDPRSLGALKTRTRNVANGLTPEGDIDVSKF